MTEMIEGYKSLFSGLGLRRFLAYPGLLVLLLVSLLFLVPAQLAKADTFVVTSNYTGTNDGDNNLSNPGCASIANGQCTLRAAIQQAQSNPDPDTISIAVPGNIITFTNFIANIDTNVTIKSNNGGQAFLDCVLPYTAACTFFSVSSTGQLHLESIRMRFAGTTALGNYGGLLTTLDSTIEQNICQDGGCGFYGSGGTTVFSHTTFLNNKVIQQSVTGGGAIFAAGGRLEIYESTFTSNTVSIPASPDANYGGALSLFDTELIISRTYFIQNQALKEGGAIYLHGQNTSQTSRIHESQFASNSSSTGGGAIWADFTTLTSGSFTLQNSTFITNTANVNTDIPVGSAVYLKNTVANQQNPAFKTFFINNTFNGNNATAGRGAIAVENQSSLELTHNTIVSNTSTGGRGGLVTASGGPNPPIKLYNNILAFNSGSDLSGSVTIVTPNLIKIANPDVTYSGSPEKVIANLDPKLSGLAYQGPSPSFQGSQTRRPLSYSPALNAGEVIPGLPTDQTTVNLRSFGGKPDLGSFEVQLVPPVIDPNGSAASGNYTAIFHPGGNPVEVTEPNNALITDQDSATFDYLEVRLQAAPDGSAESLSVDTSGTAIIASYNPNTLKLILQGTDSRANYQMVLRRIKYFNSAPVSTIPRILNYLAGDGYVYSDPATVSSTILINFGQLVEVVLDNGQATQIGTLSYAINWVNGQTNPNNKTVLFLPELTQVILQVGSLPALGVGSKISANCTNGQPQITIDGNNLTSSLAGLVLSGNNQLYGIRISNFNASKPQVLALGGNGKNSLNCVKVSS